MKRLANYKTTLVGLCAIPLAVCLQNGWLTQESVMTASLILATLLGLVAKDHDVTGGAKRVDKPKDPQP
jgi:hypothetical protein